MGAANAPLESRRDIENYSFREIADFLHEGSTDKIKTVLLETRKLFIEGLK